MFYKLPKQFIDGRICFADPGDGPEGVGNGVGGPSGSSGGSGESGTGGASPSDGPEGLGNGVGGPSGTGSGPNGAGAEAGTEDAGWRGDLIGDNIVGNESPSSTVDDRSLAERALSSLWDAAKRATAYGLTQNKAAQALEGLLNTVGYEVDFQDTVKGFLDKGFSTTEAVSKATESFRDTISNSGLNDGQKDEANSYLTELNDSLNEEDPTSFDFFLKQFSSTAEGQDILNSMYHGQTQYAESHLTQLAEAVSSQNGLLDSLLEQANTGTGVFSPVTFSFGGQDFTYVPKGQMALAKRMSELGQTKLNNLTGLFGSGLAIDKLNQDAYQFDQADENADQTREDNQPGILDYIKGITSLFG